MKKKIRSLLNPLFVIGFVFLFTLVFKTNAQNYKISFAVRGAMYILDSVEVENLNKGTKLSLLGSDILNLRIITGIKDNNINTEMIKFKPTPMEGSTELSFYASKSGNTLIQIVDISGNKIIQINNFLSQDVHKYNITGIKEGSYIVNIIGASYQYHLKFISINNKLNNASIKYMGIEKKVYITHILKNTNSIVDMDYKIGDELRYTAFTGIYKSIINDIPNASKTITFTFAVLPYVTTDTVRYITNNSATGVGIVDFDGWATISYRALCYANTHNPSTSDSVVPCGSGTGIFYGKMMGLKENSTYYVRAYIENIIGSDYGNEVNFITLPDTLPDTVITLPKLITFPTRDISCNSAVSGGYIINDGGDKITAKGICWGISPNPDVSGNHTHDGIGSDSFYSTMTGLINSIYYFRAYATNSIGTAYGNEDSIILLPIITTDYAYEVALFTATSGGNIVCDGGSIMIARGVCWSTHTNPDITDSLTSNGMDTGKFTSKITGLSLNTDYYLRAYAINSNGIYYGNQVSFKTITIADLRVGSHFQGGWIAHVYYVSGVLHCLIVAECEQDTSASWNDAINICANYSINGYNDWHLPTMNDLLNLYYDNNKISFSFSGRYWSSSFFGTNAKSMSLYTGVISDEPFNTLNIVRAVRNY